MVVDIFYPLLTLKITILACFIQKKSGDLPPPDHHLGHPGGLTAPFHTSSCKKKNNAPIFFFSRLAPNKHTQN